MACVIGRLCMQAQDLSDESEDDVSESPRLQAPMSAYPLARPDNRLSWTDSTSSIRRPPKAGPGLSLKQQASSPRWGARRGVGSSLMSPGSAFKQASGATSAQPRRSMLARPSPQVGLTVRSRRALSQDGSEHVAPDTWPLHRAQSVMVAKSQQQDLDKPFIELSDLESVQHRVDRDSNPFHRNLSAESLPPLLVESQQEHPAHMVARSEDDQDASNDYGDWADAQQQDQSDDPKRRLLQ